MSSGSGTHTIASTNACPTTLPLGKTSRSPSTVVAQVSGSIRPKRKFDLFRRRGRTSAGSERQPSQSQPVTIPGTTQNTRRCTYQDTQLLRWWPRPDAPSDIKAARAEIIFQNSAVEEWVDEVEQQILATELVAPRNDAARIKTLVVPRPST